MRAYREGILQEAARSAHRLLASCVICPRRCKVNRLKGEKGICGAGLNAEVHSFLAHHGEEPPVSGTRGSGTIFFAHCNMKCVYCQNFEFSQQEGAAGETDPEGLAGIMLELQEMKCHNINLVTPTHVMPHILQALTLAIPRGLCLPLVYNTSGYESLEMIRMLEGIVDVYLADLRYAEEEPAVRYSSAPGYPAASRAALKEMHRQVGIAQFDRDGIIHKGVIIRHLVLPEDVCGTRKIMEFVARELSPDSYISLMSQYTPYYRAGAFKEINRRLRYEEYEAAIQAMREAGLSNGWTQEGGGLERFAGVHLKARRRQEEGRP